MYEITQIRKLSIWIFFIPLIAINLCLFISQNPDFLENIQTLKSAYRDGNVKALDELIEIYNIHLTSNQQKNSDKKRDEQIDQLFSELRESKIIIAGIAVASIDIANPWITFVPCPVVDDSATLLTGL